MTDRRYLESAFSRLTDELLFVIGGGRLRRSRGQEEARAPADIMRHDMLESAEGLLLASEMAVRRG